MMKRTLPFKRAGFTLVEILIVIAILGVLGALLFGVFSRVREKGRSASCQNNLRQIAMAMHQYVGDNDGIFPPMLVKANKSVPNSKSSHWDEIIAPYIKSRAVFYCPTSEAESVSGLTGGRLPGYGYNFFDLNRRDQSRTFLGQHESNFDALADVVLNTDEPIWDGELEVKMMEASCGPQPLVDLHSGGANFSYGDGHVKWLSSGQVGEWECGVDARVRAAKDN